MSFVLGKLEPINEKHRIASLDVIQHLVNYDGVLSKWRVTVPYFLAGFLFCLFVVVGDIFREKQKNILNSLKMVTCDTSNKVSITFMLSMLLFPKF